MNDNPYDNLEFRNKVAEDHHVVGVEFNIVMRGRRHLLVPVSWNADQILTHMRSLPPVNLQVHPDTDDGVKSYITVSEEHVVTLDAPVTPPQYLTTVAVSKDIGLDKHDHPDFETAVENAQKEAERLAAEAQAKAEAEAAEKQKAADVAAIESSTT